MDASYDVCVVGTGRVGLPLALSMIDAGFCVVGVDRDPRLRGLVNDGKMPFLEPGYDELVASRRLSVHASPEVVEKSDAVIITVGTPLFEHIETDLRQIQAVLEEVQPHLHRGHLIILRSTVGPGTTEFARRWLERNTGFKVGQDILLAFCPERTAEGKAREEISALPQIVGTTDEASRAAAQALFERLTETVFHTDYVSAELIKLFNNIDRYVNFAMANQFALIADTFGANIYEIRRMANQDYPRSDIPMPGFTAGPCLRKDFGLLNEWSPYPDLMLSAWKMNEYIPSFLVKHLQRRTKIYDKSIAVLGYTFKRDSDDIRDSLAPKLYRYIHRELPTEVRVSDHNLPETIADPINGALQNWSASAAIAEADCVFVAANHTGYEEVLAELAKKRPDAWVADIWNVGGVDQIFYQAGALARRNH